MGRKNASSPAPYATSSIVQQQQKQQQQTQPRYQTRPGFNMQQQQQQPQQQMSGNQQRPMHPLFHQQQQQQQTPHQQQSSNNIYQQMSTTSEIYPSQMNSNRSTYSDQYYYPKEKIHITENKLSNCHTYDTANQQQTPTGFANIGTLRRSGNNQHSNRFKAINTQPQNYQVHLADSQHQKQQQLKLNSLNNNQQNGAGDYNTQDMITKNLMDLDAGSFCYNGMADSGCGGSPSPMAMLMAHDDENGEEQVLYHTADGDNESDMERLYVKVDDTPQQQVQQQLISLTPSHHNSAQQQQQHLQPSQQPHLHQTNQENPNQMPYNNWRSHNSSTRSANSSSSYPQRNLNVMAGNSGSNAVTAQNVEAPPPMMHHLHPLHQQLPSSDSEMIYAPGSSMASERSLLSNSGSSTCGGVSGGNSASQAHNV